MSSGFQPGLPMGSHPLDIRKGKEDEVKAFIFLLSPRWNVAGWLGSSAEFHSSFRTQVRLLSPWSLYAWECQLLLLPALTCLITS